MDEKKKKNGRPTAIGAAAITKDMLHSVQKISKLHGFKISIPNLKKSPRNKKKEGGSQSTSQSRSPKSISSQQSNEGKNFERIPVEVPEDDVSKDLVTRIGRYRVWHPEESIVKSPPRYRVSSIEELKSIYKMPWQKLRRREDGIGGATLWQPYEPVPPIGVVASIAKNLGIQGEEDIKVSYTHLGKWRDVLRDPIEIANEKKNKKRSLR